MGNLQWKKTCCTLNKYCINNKVREVSFKVLHRIYTVKEVLERFKPNIDPACVFCNSDRESLFTFPVNIRILFGPMWKTNVQTNVFEVMLYFVFSGLNNKAIYIIQFVIFLGTSYIHKLKWSDSKLCCH